MASYCRLCAGPIDPQDTHEHCIACLGLAHAETAFCESDCAHCADLPARVLRTRRNIARGNIGSRLTATNESLVSLPAPRGSGDDTAPGRCPLPSPHSPVLYADESLRPPPSVLGAVSFGAEEDDDSMSISASDKDWAGSERDRPDLESTPDLHEEFMRVLEKAVSELDITWSSPEEPAKSKLDSWYLQAGRRQATSKRSAPFFPDVHEHVVKSWSAPQSARVHAATQSMFAHVVGAEAHGYVRMPPVEETLAAHLCPSTTSVGSDPGLPSKPCRFTAHLAGKAYASAGEAASALHAMAVLQVFQAKILQSLDSGSLEADATRDLRAATDFALMATKRTAQAIGRSMGFMVVLHRHLWLTLADLKDADRKSLLNAPITPSGLFGDVVESVVERFGETQKRAKAMSHVLPRRSYQPGRPNSTLLPPRLLEVVSRMHGLNNGRARLRRGTGRREDRREDRRATTAERHRLPSRHPDGPIKRRREFVSVPVAPKRRCLHQFSPAVAGEHCNVVNVCVNAIKTHTCSQKELFPPHTTNAAFLALPRCSAKPQLIPTITSLPSSTVFPVGERRLESHARAISPPVQLASLHQRASLNGPLTVTPEEIRPLCLFLDAWKAIPDISHWLLNVIEHGYTLQFRRRPPRFSGVVPSLTSAQNAPVLRQEIGSLLAKGAIERVPPNERESGFYSRYFVVPKRDGGLRPILDLRPVNRALHKRVFRMTTLKQILAQVRPGDWFASVDLKDAYFHVQIAKRHRKFLRFAFAGSAYQFAVLPFGLALAPRTFSKCVDAALSPLRASGMRILNYLDDWLILAHSREALSGHTQMLLRHLTSLGLRVNMQKSKLTPSQSITYLGVCFDSVEMRARLSQERTESISSALHLLRPGRSVPLREFQRLLGLMASASAVCHLGLLHMRPLQFWLKARVPWRAWSSGRVRVPVTLSCLSALSPWRDPSMFSRGVPLGLVTRRIVVTTDASSSGWGAVCEGMPASGLWTQSQRKWHINCLELMAVSLALHTFQSRLEKKHVLIRTDNMSVVSYINRQGGVRSGTLFKQAASLLLWADRHLLSVRAAHIPGRLNCGADMLSREGLPHGEWRLHPDSVRSIWERFGTAEVDLFATSENAHCPLYFSLTHSPMGNDALTVRWPNVRLYAFPPVKILPLVLCKIREETATVILVAPFWPNQPWFPDLSELLTAPPWRIPLRRDLLSQANGTIFHPSPQLWSLHAWPLRGF
ncbi:uncharacterized protein LOC130425869 [Triplophysa dalaica]|uniref:uncharacterized protein LOC130425869 n=1 Tax=Triplophysa dalaica TaxID=1582913 RepID=UPI0024E03CAA|nr:uncharacterized protein LOC130425869 [Triplophysa dalaica]